MRRPKLSALGRLPPPPVHRCSCGCGAEAGHGFPFGRWYVPGHAPADIAEPAPPAPPGDLFAAAGVPAPTRFRSSPRRLAP